MMSDMSYMLKEKGQKFEALQGVNFWKLIWNFHWTNKRFFFLTGRHVWILTLVCLFVGRPWQATDVLPPAGLLYRPLWTFQLWSPDGPAPTDAFRTLAAEVGTYGRRIRTGKFCLNADFYGTFRVLLHAANLRHGTHGFTSLPKEGVLRIFPPLKIRRLRSGLNPRT
jgi:hypothetical protein